MDISLEATGYFWTSVVVGGAAVYNDVGHSPLTSSDWQISCRIHAQCGTERHDQVASIRCNCGALEVLYAQVLSEADCSRFQDATT